MSEGIQDRLTAAEFASTTENISRRLLIFRRFYTVEEDERNYYADSTHDQSLWDITTRAWLLVGIEPDLKMSISAAQQLECQERKDKIFGLISLIDWGICGPLIPDYTQTEFEVAVSFFKALLNAWYEGGTRHTWDIAFAGAQVVRMLQLDNNPPGVPSAVEARRIEPVICLANAETNLERIHSKHPTWPGWRVSSGHLTKNDSGFSTWSLSGSDKCKVYLPFWVQDGNWIVLTRRAYSFSGFVLVREVVEGLGGPLIGRAFSGTFHTKEAPSANFRIYWDPEDLVIHSIMQEEMMDLSFDSRWYPTESVRRLNTAICRKGTPGSSYALRYD